MKVHAKNTTCEWVRMLFCIHLFSSSRASDANYRDEREHFRAFFELFKEWTSTPSVWCGGGSGGAC